MLGLIAIAHTFYLALRVRAKQGEITVLPVIFLCLYETSHSCTTALHAK